MFHKVKNGDDESFKAIYESTYRSQYFIALNYLNDSYYAQEAVQNMYITFYKHINDIKNDMAIIQWMNTTTINECRTIIRKEKLNNRVDIQDFEDSITDESHNPEETYRNKQEAEILNKALNKLEPDIKELIIYRFVDNLKIREISKITKLSNSTINRYIKKGTDKLKKYIKNINKDIYGIAITPFVIKLINDVMKQISNKEIFDSYTKFAKNVAKAGTALIAGSTGSKIAMAGAKKGATSATKVAIGAGTTVAATAAVVAAVASPNYSIAPINPNYVLNQAITIVSDNKELINNIYCYKDDDLIGTLNENNEYSINITQNGKYRIVVEDIVGKTQEEEIEIDNIDIDCPTIEIVKNDDSFVATINDSKSGIDYSRITITNQDGQKVDYTVEGNSIIFTNVNPTTTLTVYDKLGNNKKLTLNNH